MVDVMAEHDALLPYLDMPIQHADPTVLRNMNRPSDIDMTRRLIDHARAKMPDVVMRTTLIVGYPGETDQQFQTLLDFVEEQEFDHVGVFTYSPEPGTKAVTLDLPAVPTQIAEERRNAIMEAQQAISLRKNQALVGQTLQVLIEAVGEAEDEAGNTEPIVGRPRATSRAGGRWAGLRAGRAAGRRAHRTGDRGGGSVRSVGASAGVREPRRPWRREARRRRVSEARSRAANRPERRGQGARVPMATLAGTGPTGRG